MLTVMSPYSVGTRRVSSSNQFWTALILKKADPLGVVELYVVKTKWANTPGFLEESSPFLVETLRDS